MRPQTSVHWHAQEFAGQSWRQPWPTKMTSNGSPAVTNGCLALARQRLLFMCTCCQMDSQMRYHSAALFDAVIALLGSTAADQEQLLTVACACLLIAVDSFRPQTDVASAWELISQAAERAAGPDCQQPPRQRVLDLQDMLQQQLPQDDSRPLVTDYIQTMHNNPLLTGLPELEFVELSTCYSICDVLLCSSRFSGGLRSGGKLMAAAVIAAAWMVQVPLAEVPAIAPLRRLEQLSGCPADVVEAQAQVIMHFILDAEEHES